MTSSAPGGTVGAWHGARRSSPRWPHWAWRLRDAALHYRTAATSIDDSVSAACDDGEVLIGGGISLSGPAAEARANSFNPFADTTDPPDDGFTAAYGLVDGPVKTLTAQAICLP